MAAVPAPAEAAPPAWHGVWQGTIGSLPVRACLDGREDGLSRGSYYYMSKLVPITLTKEEAAGGWSERTPAADESGGDWTLTSRGANQLTGQWRSGSKSLAIALTRVAARPHEDGPCASSEFHAPRIRPVRVTSAPERREGIAYTKLTYNVGPAFPDTSIIGFAIREQAPGDRAINAALRVDTSKPDAGYLECDRLQVAQNGYPGAYVYEAEPDLLTADFLSASISSGGDCGGAHPDDTTFHRTFDRKSGVEVHLGTWFTARGVKPRAAGDDSNTRELTRGLRAVILRQARFDEAECREAVSSADYWDIALARGGLKFTPSLPHVVAACEEAISVPSSALAAWLSPAGRQGMARLGAK
ncbi:MAG: hypothetical protein AB7F98_12955 [Novosphingobium sp.]